MKETWKPIIGYEGLYQVSDLGKVRSLKFGKERILKPGMSAGYLAVGLCNNGQKTRKVHQLVAEAFIGPRPDGYETCHKDDVKTNNVLTNLYYGTKSENLGGDRNRNNPDTSKYNGVSWYKRDNKWRASIKVDGKLKHIGMFHNEVDAAIAFDKFCIENALDRKLNALSERA